MKTIVRLLTPAADGARVAPRTTFPGRKIWLLIGVVLMIGSSGSLSTGIASAATIDWIDWTSATTGTTTGTATGTIPPTSVTVAYSGEVRTGTPASYPSWGPAATFSGGTVGNAPPVQTIGIIGLMGGSGTGTNTITFSSAVVNPVMAIWSLGAGGTTASFNFTGNPSLTIESGGASNEYGGSSISQVAGQPYTVYGAEGNGTLQFNGTFTQISWTNPAYENWYGFTAGIAGVATPGVVPEPSTLALMGSVVPGSLAILWRRRRKGTPTEK